MSWETYRVSEWADFVKVAAGTFELSRPFQDAYVYRGQPDTRWTLKPSLLRTLGPTISTSDGLKIEEKLRSRFLARAHLHVSSHIAKSLDDRGNCWSLMQHYSAPTRLLDWTKSPFVAAYFACVSRPENDGAVWMLHVKSLNDGLGGLEAQPDRRCPDDFFTEQDVPLLKAISIDTEFDRMAAQQGVFTGCSNILSDHAEVVSNYWTANSPDTAVKVLIDQKQKPAFLHQLRAMNITGESLFPGLEGLGKSLFDIARLAGGDG